MIIFDQVSKEFPTGETVLRDISLTIAPQEFVVISGPSGSGKTTFLRLIIKDLEPTKGTISVDGEDITKLNNKHIPRLRRKVGFVFQDFKIIPDKTIWENIALSLEIVGLKTQDIADRIKHLLELVGLPNKGELFPRQLSGGELQRVSIARAIAAQPQVLLADEPTGNLDAETAWGIAELLQQINDLGTTVIVATHNQDLISKMPVRHLELREGILKEISNKLHHKKKHKEEVEKLIEEIETESNDKKEENKE